MLLSISYFKELSNAHFDKICQLFTEEQIKKLIDIDPHYGYNLKEPNECIEALNKLPRRERRKLIERIKERKSLAGITKQAESGDPDPAFELALKEKYAGNIFTPGAILPPFDMDDLFDNEMLHYTIFDDNDK